jgi:fibronectin type 3 domain-containing protein
VVEAGLDDFWAATFWCQSLPEPVDDLTATLAGHESGSDSSDVRLTWSVPASEAGIDHYVVYRSSDVSAVGDSLDVATDTTYLDMGAAGSSGSNYYYVVKVVDSLGRKSGVSSQVGEFDVELMNGTK